MLLENLSLGLAVGLFALIVASLWDIKIREVPDWISYSLSFFAIGYASFLSIYYQNAGFLINSVAGMMIGTGIGLLMFYTGQWGGGDSKLIIGISAIFGFSVPGISNLYSNHEILVFFVNTLFVGAVYGLTFSLWKAFEHRKECKIEAIKQLSQKRLIIARIALLVLVGLALCYFIVAKSVESIILFASSIAAILIFYIWIIIKCVENVCMIRETKVSSLTEGDWIIEEVKKSDQIILKPTKTGVTAKEIRLLKDNNVKTVIVKEGMPFVPSFLFAYILTLILHNWLILLF
jgi:Flp pilus assembly protein protease CpaA